MNQDVIEAKVPEANEALVSDMWVAGYPNMYERKEVKDQVSVNMPTNSSTYLPTIDTPTNTLIGPSAGRD